MSYGLGGWGTSGWGGTGLNLIDQVPIDTSTGNARLPTISFSLVSTNGDIITSTINVTANGTSLVVNGVFQTTATGTIDATIPTSVQVTMQVTSAYSPLTTVDMVVTALNANNEPIASGGSWQFTVDSTTTTFTNYVVRAFQRVLRVAT